jgi:hypothetical protein
METHYADLIPPLQADELRLLEESLREEGCRDPLIVWDGKLIDGHNRKRICEANCIPYQIKERTFADEAAARIWIRKNQLGRRNVNEAWRIELARANKKELEAEGTAKMAKGGGDRKSAKAKSGLSKMDKPDLPAHDTRKEIAKAAKSSVGQVARAEVVIERRPDLWEKAKAGELTVGGAYAKAAGKADKSQMAYACKLDDRESNEWFTPEPYIQSATVALGGSIDLDPYSSKAANRIVKAESFFTEAQDARTQTWKAGSVWMNPPYSATDCRDAVLKFLDAWEAKEFKAGIILVNNATETKWFQKALWAAMAFCFTDHRISFWNEDGKAVSGNTRGQVFFYFGSKPAKFAEAFQQHGCVIFGKQVA